MLTLFVVKVFEAGVGDNDEGDCCVPAKAAVVFGRGDAAYAPAVAGMECAPALTGPFVLFELALLPLS